MMAGPRSGCQVGAQRNAILAVPAENNQQHLLVDALIPTISCGAGEEDFVDSDIADSDDFAEPQLDSWSYSVNSSDLPCLVRSTAIVYCCMPHHITRHESAYMPSLRQQQRPQQEMAQITLLMRTLNTGISGSRAYLRYSRHRSNHADVSTSVR